MQLSKKIKTPSQLFYTKSNFEHFENNEDHYS